MMGSPKFLFKIGATIAILTPGIAYLLSDSGTSKFVNWNFSGEYVNGPNFKGTNLKTAREELEALRKVDVKPVNEK